MRNLFFAFVTLSLFISCSKHDDIYGDVHAYGKVLDKESREPISGATVYFYSVLLKDRSYGGRERVYTLRDSLITGSDGKFEFRFFASGQYEFELKASPNDGLHVSSDYTVGLKDVIWESGSHYHVLGCHRSATVHYNIQNEFPFDTIYFSTTGMKTYYHLELFKDTNIYLTLPANRGINEQFNYQIRRYNPYSVHTEDFDREFKAWDTLEVPILY